ncbi:MAG: hypothetical protein HYX92_05530 [Chloroflexi bacterium]|nr:hypothetical protein [Chloroflexota bacterium]
MPKDRRKKARDKRRSSPAPPIFRKVAPQPRKPTAKRPAASPQGSLLKPAIFIIIGLGVIATAVAFLWPRQPAATTEELLSPTPRATPTATPTPRPTLTPTSTATPRPTATPTITPTPEPTPTPIIGGGTPLPGFNFAGRGPLVTTRMELNPGVAIFTLKHFGASAFAVSLQDSQGQKVEVLASAAGLFDGSRPVGITRAGQYALDIQADGNWTAFVEQPRPASAEPPSRMEGQGLAASKLFALRAGPATFRFTHAGAPQGTKPFVVWLLDLSGRRIESLANAMGNFNGSKTIQIGRAGVYLLSIEADGKWTVDAEQ